MKKNTRAQGDAFRDDVFGLLRMLPGIRRIEREFPVEYQAVDIYYEELTSFGIAAVACECKDYGRPLTRTDLEAIWAKYGPLARDGHVRAFRVITPLPPAVDAQRFAKTNRFTITTVDELEARLMDFGTYLQAVKLKYTEGGLDRYYKPPTFVSGEDAGESLSKWIAGDSSRPVAILASYGMGKTSFARHFAACLVDKHLEDASARIPILIELADISTEQDIRGLITKHLAAQNVVHNFHYDLFRSLNRRGRFVLILDGFDEMKHTMSFHDIRFNFAEINSLSEGDSRVLLLGRPSVFKDDAERQYALHGVRAQNAVRVQGFHDYIEHELREFDVESALATMRAYGAYSFSGAAPARVEAVSPALFDERIDAIRNNHDLLTLSQRPVQARMLADLALDPRVEWRSFTRYELYDEFVVGFLERETLKPARRRFDSVVRSDFQRAIAYWMWNTDRTGGFEAHTVPRSIYGARVEQRDEQDGVLRDLLTGSLLECKAQDRFYFPHRSYLEFLVAQKISSTAWNARDLGQVSEALTPEILGFIKENPQLGAVASWNTRLNEIEVPVSDLFLAAIAYSLRHDDFMLREEATVRDVFVQYFRMTYLQPSAERVRAQLGGNGEGVVNPRSRMALHYCQAAYTIHTDKVQALRELCAQLLLEAYEEMGRILESRNERSGRSLRVGSVVDPHAVAMQLVASSCIKRANDGGEFTIGFTPDAFEGALMRLFQDDVEAFAAAMPEGQVGFSLQELARADDELRLSKRGARVLNFFSSYPDPSTLIRVIKVRAASPTESPSGVRNVQRKVLSASRQKE